LGKRVPADIQESGPTFKASLDMGANLAKGLEPTKEALVKLTCRVTRRGAEGNFWFAEVVQVKFADGKEVDPTPGAPEKEKGITGTWHGSRKNKLQGELGEDWLYVKEFTEGEKAGQVVGEWGGVSIKNGVRVPPDLFTWEAESPNKDLHYVVRCKVSEDGRSLSITYTLTFKEDGIPMETKGEAHLTRK